MKRILNAMAVMGLVLLCLCLRVGAQGTPVAGSVEATGKLVKVMAVGAETTGWAIELESEQSFGGKPQHSIEVRGDAKKLGKLENKKVTAKGTIEHRSGVETGDRIVLVVQKIKEWKAPEGEKKSNY
jgi:hypothetical protein